MSMSSRPSCLTEQLAALGKGFDFPDPPFAYHFGKRG